MYLSGFLVKTALYGFYKYTSIIGLGMNTTLFIAIAGIGVVDASIKMFSQVDLKKLVAFCTVQEMNMIYMMLCWGDSTGCISAMLFTITHSFLSALMFFLVDCVQRRYNSRSTLELSGIIHLTPNLGIAIFIMCLLYCGMPGTMKFTCEFFIFSQIIGVSFLFTFILLFFANLIGVVGFCRCWFNVLFGMSTKLSKLNIIDLNMKELQIITVCIVFLIAFCYTPCLFF
jgi:NADH-quinone oxidoreductase subunit M